MGIHTEKKEPKQKITKKEWLKNFGKSSKDLFIDWLAEQGLFRFVDGELKAIRKESERRKRTPKEKETLKKKVAKLGKGFIEGFIENYKDETGNDLKKEIDESFGKFIRNISTGKIYERDTTFDFDMDDLLDDLEDDWDERSAYGEVYFIGKILDEAFYDVLEIFTGYNKILIDDIKEKGEINKTEDALIVYRYIKFGYFYKIPISFVIKNKKKRLSDIQKKIWTKYHNKMEALVKSSLPSALQYIEREVGRGFSKRIAEMDVRGIILERDGKVEVCFYTKYDDNRELTFTMSTYTSIRGSAENYIKLGDENVEHINDLRDRLLTDLKLTTVGEGAEILGPVKPIGQNIYDIKNKVINYLNETEHVTDSIFNAVRLKNSKQQIKTEIKALIETIAHSDQEITDTYKDSIVNTIISLFAVDTAFNLRDIYENPNKDVKSILDRDIEDVYSVNPEIGSEVMVKAEPIMESIKATKASLNFKPIDPEEEQVPNEDEEDYDDKEPSSASGESFSTGTINTLRGVDGISKITVAAIGLIGGVAFAIKNLVEDKKNLDFEKKFGSSLTIKEPLIATDDLSKSIVATLSKYIETSNAIEYKKALESSIASKDKGNLLYRAKKILPGTATRANLDIEGKKRNSVDDYDETISAFYQSYFPYMECLGLIGMRNKEEMYFIQNVRSVGTYGEAGEFVNDNRHSPTTVINVEVMYKDTGSKDILKLGGYDTLSKKTSITIDVAGRRLRVEDVLKSLIELNDNYFKKIKVTNEEQNTAKRAKFGINLFKKQGTPEEKRVLTSNPFADIVNKIQKVRTPLFHLAISLEAYHILKNKGLDLRNPKDYKKVMNELPLITLSIVDEDTEIVSMSAGMNSMFRDIPFDQLEGEISKYEKELQAILKYGAQR